MSLLASIQKTKEKLKPTKTIITTTDGQKITDDGVIISTGEYGFVIDTKPDTQPSEILDGLFLGSQDCVNLDVLEKYGITNILSLGVRVQINMPSKINQKFVECLDLPETNINKILKETCPFIENALNQNERVLVHCNAGVSRSSSVIIGYLILNKFISFEEAYKTVKSKRQCIRPNDGFVKQLKVLQK